MKLNPSDIIVATCPEMPICYHVGIVVFENGMPIIYNNTPSAQNMFGGNVVAQPLNQFLKGRKIIRTIPTRCTPGSIEEVALNHRYKKWNHLTYNCEDFISQITNGEQQSPIRVAWQSAVFLGLLCFLP